MNTRDLRWLLAAGMLAFGATSATVAHAQLDEFDDGPRTTTPTSPTSPTSPTTSTTPTPPRPSIPSIDVFPSDEATAAVVRVVVTRAIELSSDAQLPCAHGRVARGTLSSSTGFVTSDGAYVLASHEALVGAAAIAVHGANPAELHAAVLVHTDADVGVAVLRLVTPMPAVARGTPELPPVDHPVTSVSREADGSIAFDTGGRVRLVNALGIGVPMNASGPEGTRIVYRNGAPIGLFVGRLIPTVAIPQVVLLPSLDPAMATAGAVAAIPEPIARVVESSSRALIALSAASTPDARCAAIVALGSEPATPADLDPSSVSPTIRVLLAAHAWNGLVTAEGARSEPDVGTPPFVLVDAAYADDASGLGRMRFVVQVRALAREEADRLTRAEAARVRREQEAAEARRAQERRDRRSATYQVGLAAAFARDGSSGLGGAMVTGGVFTSIPRLSPTKTFQAALAVGGSAAIGGNGGVSGLLTLDLGVSLRFGGDLGGFVLLAYSPGLTSRVLDDASAFVASSYRAAAGLALGRRVVYLGARVLAPSGDYPLYLLEVGGAFRHGPPRRPAPEPDRATATRRSSSMQ